LPRAQTDKVIAQRRCYRKKSRYQKKSFNIFESAASHS